MNVTSNNTMIARYKHPLVFYGLSIAIPWATWFLAAYLSHLDNPSPAAVMISGWLGVAGLAAPTVIAFWMMLRDPNLKNDLWNRLFHWRSVPRVYLVLTLTLMLASILCAQGISLLFGYSADQFHVVQKVSFSFSLFSPWIMMVLAPLLEELAWHSYGTDCLRARFSLFTTSVIFSVFWALWHFPLAFIKGYYHSNVAEEGFIYALNFAVSLLPFVLLMNWLYYKTNRNIMVAMVFHLTANMFNEMFQTHPDSKIIQTVLLSLLCLYLIGKDKGFFFKREYVYS